MKVGVLGHGRARQAGHDAAVHACRVGVALVDPEGQVARTGGEAFGVGLLLLAIALAGRAATERAARRESRARPQLGLLRVGRFLGNRNDARGIVPVRIGLAARRDRERALRERLDVVDEAPARGLGQMAPRRHRRPGHPARDRAEQVLVGGRVVPGGDQAELAAGEVPGPRCGRELRLAAAPRAQFLIELARTKADAFVVDFEDLKRELNHA